MKKKTIIKILTVVLIALFTFNNPVIAIASIDMAPRSFSLTTVTLPSGITVQALVLMNGSDFSNEEKNDINEEMLENYPSFKILSDPTKKIQLSFLRLVQSKL